MGVKTKKRGGGVHSAYLGRFVRHGFGRGLPNGGGGVAYSFRGSGLTIKGASIINLSSGFEVTRFFDKAGFSLVMQWNKCINIVQ